ncbi:MAG: hypothetical protein H6586_08175 [Flavobacteriales bacterium]|nr:hypothetical protein [Flavobacteriales bacterium]
MKKLNYLLALILSVALYSCGNGENQENETQETEQKVLKGYEELDLNQWGFQMTIMVPNAEENGEPQIVLTERGALEIIVGQTFGIEIMYGEGDIELLKMDLKEDLVFSSEIVKEDENSLIYKQDIPDSGVKTQNHFFYRAQVGTDVYEVRDLIDGSYGMAMIEKMLDAAKTIKEKKISQTPA